MEGENKSSNRLVWVFLTVIATLIAVGVVLYYERDTIKDYILPDKQVVEPVEEVEYVPTVQEILESREEIRESHRMDSVFLSLPDVILVDILVTHGTSLSVSDIVTIYESNKDAYGNVLKGAVIQKNIIEPYEKAPTLSQDTLQRELWLCLFRLNINLLESISVCEDRYTRFRK